MKMQMTSFYANKLIHNLEDELRHWKEKENELSTFVVTDSENAIGPDYDFQEVSSKMESINKKNHYDQACHQSSQYKCLY